MSLANIRRLYHHVSNGGKATKEDIGRLVEYLENIQDGLEHLALCFEGNAKATYSESSEVYVDGMKIAYEDAASDIRDLQKDFGF